MKNWEKQKDEILKVAIKGERCALVEDKVVNCSKIDCSECDLGILGSSDSCPELFERWCQEEYEELEDKNKIRYYGF